jgi:hypothetical protein
MPVDNFSFGSDQYIYSSSSNWNLAREALVGPDGRLVGSVGRHAEGGCRHPITMGYHFTSNLYRLLADKKNVVCYWVKFIHGHHHPSAVMEDPAE